MSAVFAICAPAAMADESAMPTAQAQAYNADWVPYLDPPEKPAAVCLVDSGVNITPDTPADSPSGPIVKRLALDGGSGEAASPTWEGLHGTRMAFVGAAPVNGWGAVGFWPGARIVSIRAMPADQTAFPFDYYSKAVELCSKSAASLQIAAVNLSLGCDCAPTDDERIRLALQIARAHNNGESVVAATGNSAGPVGAPASEPSVFSVAAGDTTTALCPFSNRGAGVDLVAPGCDVDLADPSSGQLWSGYQSGTSGASMTTSIVLALLRSYRPDLSWQGAEQLVASSARPSAAGPVLDVEALFRAAGLGALVSAAKARVPAAPAPAGGGASDAPAGAAPSETTIVPDDNGAIWLDAGTKAKGRFPAPKLDSILRMGRRLTVSVRNRPRGARLVLALESRPSEFGYATVARAARASDRLGLRLPRRWRGGRLALRYELPEHRNKTSPSVYRAVRR